MSDHGKDKIIMVCIGIIILLLTFLIHSREGLIFLGSIISIVCVLAFLWWVIERTLSWRRIDHWFKYGFPPVIRVSYHILLFFIIVQVIGFSLYLGGEGLPNLSDFSNDGILAIILGVIGVGIGIWTSRL